MSDEYDPGPESDEEQYHDVYNYVKKVVIDGDRETIIMTRDEILFLCNYINTLQSRGSQNEG